MACLPAAARHRDFSFRLLYSRMGVLCALTAQPLGIALLGQFVPHLANANHPGTPTVWDLYPYLYLGLSIPSFFWQFVLRPLQITFTLNPTGKLPPTLAILSGMLITEAAVGNPAPPLAHRARHLSHIKPR
ncbi:MAG: hypothetical protein R3E31_10995 [Chloroflexota bacterium]